MIHIHCDKCERELAFDDSQAGEKVECPHCGDVNRLPAAPKPAAKANGNRSAVQDRATAQGLPPDSGPEVRVTVIRPSLIRSKPIVSALLALGPVALSITLLFVVSADRRPMWLMVWPPIAGWVVLGVWAIFVRLSACLIISNKRTVLRHGMLSRSTSEVLHDHVRNIEIDQSLTNRLCRVGTIGISSSGQDGIEVQIGRMPNPRRLREIIDLYRPL